MATLINITGKNALDTMARTSALNTLNTLSTDELQKLAQMATPKGRATLQNKWFLIKKFI